MQIILIQDIDNLGGINEVVNVKNGYARNYLIPQKMAIEVNPSNLTQLNEKLKVQQKKEAAMLSEINKVIDALKESPVKISAKTGTSGKIFGSVTTLQLSRAIRDQKGFQIDRKKIQIPEEVKELGLYKAVLDFGNGNNTEMEFEVTGEE